MMETRPWKIRCDVCDKISEESYRDLNFCSDCFGWFRTIESSVDFKATPSKVVEHMKKKETGG